MTGHLLSICVAILTPRNLDRASMKTQSANPSPQATPRRASKAEEANLRLVALRRALGFDSNHDEKLSEPYVQYIKSSWPGRGEKADYLRFFTEVVEHCKRLRSFFKPLSISMQMDYPQSLLIAD